METNIAFGLGAVYQIDSTKGDVYLVSQYNRGKIIGRATVYLVVDVFSGLIAGFLGSATVSVALVGVPPASLFFGCTFC